MAQRVDTAGAGRSARMDIGQFDPPLTDTAQGALCIPGARSALLEGTRPPGAAGTRRLQAVAAGLSPGDSQPRSCVCTPAWIVAPGRCPQRCTSPTGLSENPGEVHGSHSEVPEPRHLGPLPLGGRCGSPCASNEGTATPGGQGGGGRSRRREGGPRLEEAGRGETRRAQGAPTGPYSLD